MTNRSPMAEPPARRVYEVDVPMLGRPPSPPLTANLRLHWRARHARSKKVRHAVAWHARALGLGRVARLTATLHYQPGDNRPRDPSNLMPTQKPAVDGLVDAGLVPDDTPEFVHERVPVIHPGRGERRLWLEIEVHP